MNVTRKDFLDFCSLGPDERQGWLQARFPSGTPAHWWFFVIESLESRLSRFSEASTEERRNALRLGIEVASFAVSVGNLSVPRSVVVIARLLERASLLEEPVGLTDPSEVDSVIRMALGATMLSPEAALAAADRRREEAKNLEESVHRPGSPSTQDELPEDGDMLALIEVEEMLVALRPLFPRIVDPDLRLQIEVWFSLEERFSLGGAASDEVIRRWEKKG
ncbi:hypothetical protein ABZ891_20485 [Streptomyces sp. NPDC047023]|uniref:hypothetical protein n=1 Tax=Streptomyces sp. NPDC047023 TaxID=3155139 RepID=UPI003400D101